MGGLMHSSWGLLKSKQHVCLHCFSRGLHDRRDIHRRLDRKHSFQVCCVEGRFLIPSSWRHGVTHAVSI